MFIFNYEKAITYVPKCNSATKSEIIPQFIRNIINLAKILYQSQHYINIYVKLESTHP